LLLHEDNPETKAKDYQYVLDSTVDVRRNCTAAVNKFRDRLNCRRDVFENMALRRPAAMDACQCYPPCSDVTYDSSYSLSTLPPDTNEYRMFYTHIKTFLQEKMSPERRRLLGVGDYDDKTVLCFLSHTLFTR